MSSQDSTSDDTHAADQEKTDIQISSSIQAGKVEGDGSITGTKIGNVFGSVTVINQYDQDRLVKPREDLTAAVIERQAFEPETVFISAGLFLMGRDTGPDVPLFETPSGQVSLSAYRIGKFPVTNDEFVTYLRNTHQMAVPEMGWEGQNPIRGQENFPVRGISWFEALDYCRWLSQQTGRTYLLPNEAQWEKAARGAAGSLFPWGNDWQPERCNQGKSDLAPVSAYPAQNELGLYDLAGNVLQWTTTLWGEKRLRQDPRFPYPWQNDGRDDLEANKQIRRVLRGSAYTDPPEACTGTARRSFLPTDRGQPGKWHGFRVVMILEARS